MYTFRLAIGVAWNTAV